MRDPSCSNQKRCAGHLCSGPITLGLSSTCHSWVSISSIQFAVTYTPTLCSVIFRGVSEYWTEDRVRALSKLEIVLVRFLLWLSSCSLSSFNSPHCLERRPEWIHDVGQLQHCKYQFYHRWYPESAIGRRFPKDWTGQREGYPFRIHLCATHPDFVVVTWVSRS